MKKIIIIIGLKKLKSFSSKTFHFGRKLDVLVTHFEISYMFIDMNLMVRGQLYYTLSNIYPFLARIYGNIQEINYFPAFSFTSTFFPPFIVIFLLTLDQDQASCRAFKLLYLFIYLFLDLNGFYFDAYSLVNCHVVMFPLTLTHLFSRIHSL